MRPDHDPTGAAEQAFDVVIIGGGFAGATLAQQLEQRLEKRARIALLSRDNFITYNPMLAEVVGASILPGQVVAPLRQMLRRTQFRMLEVTGIDFAERAIAYRGGTHCSRIGYDHLVLAVGARANLDLVPGMARYGLPLKTVGDALYLRNRVIERLEEAQLQPDPELRRRLTTFVVVGGGFSGVEVAGEINDFLREALRYYPGLRRADVQVALIHSGPHLLPEISPRLGAFTHRQMTRRGVRVLLEDRVTAVEQDGVLLAGGERLPCRTVVCTIGTATNPLTQALDLHLERGRIHVEPDFSVPGRDGVWALGDCAAPVNAYDGKICPPTAQFAVRQAKHLAENLARARRGYGTRPFRYRPLGQMAAIGHNRAVAQIPLVQLAGFFAWLLWRGFYLMKFPTLARKVRIFMEWNWGMLFPPDTVNLRMARSATAPAISEGEPHE